MPISQEVPGFEPGDEATRELVIILHAYMSGPENLNYVRNVVCATRPGADFFIPAMPTGLFSVADPANIVRKLLHSVDRLSSAKGGLGYDRITLIGHSLGALLARKLYVCARGENFDAPFERCLSEVAAKPRAWADRVDRIILLAGMNRGWSLSHHLSIRRLVEWTICRWLAASVLKLWTGREPLILTIHRGASFITQLRIQWLSMIRRAKKAKEAGKEEIKLAPTIQLLGSIDDMVSPEDNVDLVSGSEFAYIDVPMTGHANVVEMDATPAGQERRRVFKTALCEDPERLRIESLQPGDYQLVPNEQIKHVVFVIHGIRDKGYWTQKIARRAMTLWRDKNPDPQPNFASVTSTYGYFPMLPFILPSRRTEKVQWLMDQYTEALARYPNADFYYVGHSNGTYLLARALKDNPSCHFKRVVFAGSVVRTDFDWSSLQQSSSLPDGEVTKPQVGLVLNYVATNDWVVAFFPKALELLHLQDLGSAGHDGFVQLGKSAEGQQVNYVHGDHGAALREENWNDIAHFIVDGDLPKDSEARFTRQQSPWVRGLGRIAPVVWLVLLVLAVGIGWGIASFIGSPFWRGIAVIVYIWSLLNVLTRF